MSDVLQTKILYDDRFTHYHNIFTETKVVHKPFLEEYLKEIIPNDDTIIPVSYTHLTLPTKRIV